MMGIEQAITKTYEDLSAHTTFPAQEDKLIPKRAPYANEIAYINQYNQYFANGDLVSAQQVLIDHPDIIDAMIDLDFLLTIHHSQIAVERFFREEVVDYIKNLQAEASQEMTDSVNQFKSEIQSLVTFEGEFDASKTYKQFQVVSYLNGENTNYYMVIVDKTIGNLPTSDKFVQLTLKGDKGESGTGLTPRGVFNPTNNATTMYYLYDLVSYDGYLWYAKQDNFQGQTPSDESTYWEKFLVVTQYNATDVIMQDGSTVETKITNIESRLPNNIAFSIVEYNGVECLQVTFEG